MSVQDRNSLKIAERLREDDQRHRDNIHWRIFVVAILVVLLIVFAVLAAGGDSHSSGEQKEPEIVEVSLNNSSPKPPKEVRLKAGAAEIFY